MASGLRIECGATVFPSNQVWASAFFSDADATVPTVHISGDGSRTLCGVSYFGKLSSTQAYPLSKVDCDKCREIFSESPGVPAYIACKRHSGTEDGSLWGVIETRTGTEIEFGWIHRDDAETTAADLVSGLAFVENGRVEYPDPCDCGTVFGDNGGYLPHAIGGHLDCTGADWAFGDSDDA